MKQASDILVLGLFIITIVYLGVNFMAVQHQIAAMKPGPNEYRGHIYGNKLSMPKRELEIVQGILKHDPAYDSAVLMEEK